MERGTQIAVIVAGAGVLVAGSVAAVAVINAASSTPEPSTVAVVADTTVQSAAPTTAPVASAAPLPSLAVSALPELPVVTTPDPIVITEQPAAPSPKASAKNPTKPKATAKPKPRATTQEPVAQPEEQLVVAEQPAAQPRLISNDEAVVAVMSQVSGTVLDTTRTSRGGYDAIAVKVQRSDKSTVTGFVDRASGVVFDWTQTAPPAQQQQAKPKPGGESEHESGEHEGGEHEGGEHEGGEHEGGGDDD